MPHRHAQFCQSWPRLFSVSRPSSSSPGAEELGHPKCGTGSSEHQSLSLQETDHIFVVRVVLLLGLLLGMHGYRYWYRVSVQYCCYILVSVKFSEYKNRYKCMQLLCMKTAIRGWLCIFVVFFVLDQLDYSDPSIGLKKKWYRTSLVTLKLLKLTYLIPHPHTFIYCRIIVLFCERRLADEFYS